MVVKDLAAWAGEEWERTFDAVPDPIMLLDKEHRIVRVNRAMAERLGATPEECVGKYCYRAVHRTAEPPGFCPHSLLLQDGEEHTVEVPEPALKGDFLVSVTPLRNAEGEVIGSVHVARDITDRKRAERELRRAYDQLEARVEQRTAELKEANAVLRTVLAERKRMEEELRASEERFRTIANYAYDLEEWIAPNGQLIWVNPAVHRVTGYTVDECLAMPDYPMPFIHEDDRAAVSKLHHEAMGGSSGTGCEFRARRKDGTVVWLEASWQPVYGNDGTSLGFRKTIRDITERRQAEQRVESLRGQLAHLGRLKSLGEMASGLAHELNQPLAVVVMQAELAAQQLRLGDEPSKEDRLKRLQTIADEAYRAGQIIRRMREFVQRVDPHRTSVHLAEILDEVIPLVESDLRHASVALHVDVDRALPMVQADKIQVQQVLLNLLRNALEAIETAGPGDHEISIRGEVRRGCLEVAVRDTGSGIPQGSAERLFDNFYSTKDDGMGVGLGISRSIIEAHSGHIWAKRNRDRGSTFLFTLPLAPQEQ